MSTVWYGVGVGDDSEYRLCGDVTGKRVIELGIAPTPPTIEPNAVVLARAGAKSIAVDPSGERIDALRRAAEQAEVRVECHTGELPDLGFATSASVELVVASHTIDDVDDMARLLRQVHRVLKPDATFVVALTHPVAAMFDAGNAAPARKYGAMPSRSLSELFMAFERTNFHIEVMHEITPVTDRAAMAPSVLLLRARKVGV
jgi:ubiquinone/menaquinone biosynthesis C-methylase UbiE